MLSAASLNDLGDHAGERRPHRNVDRVRWNSRQFIRTGIAASAIAHLSVLALVLFFAEVHPFGSVTAEPIAVDHRYAGRGGAGSGEGRTAAAAETKAVLIPSTFPRNRAASNSPAPAAPAAACSAAAKAGGAAPQQPDSQASVALPQPPATPPQRRRDLTRSAYPRPRQQRRRCPPSFPRRPIFRSNIM